MESQLSAMNDIGQTAFLVAHWRHEESDRRGGLFRDPYAELFTNERVKELSRGLRSIIPGAAKFVHLRTRYIDEVLTEYQKKGFSQFLIPGAGFDMRAYRFAGEGFQFFETDQPPVLEFKRNVIRNLEINRKPVLTDGDYVSEGLCRILEKSPGFRKDLPVLIIWEGNSMYLSEDSIRGLLRQIKTNLPGAHIVFDHLGISVDQEESTGILKAITDKMKNFGAPFKTGFSDIESFLAQAGFTLLDSCDCYELANRWGSEVSNELKAYRISLASA